MTYKKRNIGIMGGGLGGSLLASHLASDGHTVSLFESRNDPRTFGFIGGRSINLAISTRGLTALNHVGLKEKVLKQALPMNGRIMHYPKRPSAFQSYSSRKEDCIYSISRSFLNIQLLNHAAEQNKLSLFFSSKVTDIDLEDPSVTINDLESHSFDLIVGCDGTFSKIRTVIGEHLNFPNQIETLKHGYKELCIPSKNGTWALDPKALHIWPHGRSMMIALPNPDHTFTCTLFWPFQGEHSFETLNASLKDSVSSNDELIISFFKKHYPSAFPLMPTLLEDWQKNPISDLPMVRCPQYHYKGTTVLLGDSAHAIVPFYGQGMNCAFEDVKVLADCLKKYSINKDALEAYNNERKPNGDAISELALQNFIEMRDHVSSKIFLFEKRLSQLVHKIFPAYYTPIYNLVSFSNLPYNKILQKSTLRHNFKKIGLTVLLLTTVWTLFILIKKFIQI